MKILFVEGDGDYGANAFELIYNPDDGLSKALKKAEENGGSFSEDSDDGRFNVELKEFGIVDEKFIDFIKDKIQDYDDSKHTNFYIVGGERKQ